MAGLTQKDIDGVQVEPEIYRRILDALNNAHRPEDLPRFDEADIGKDVRHEIIEKRAKMG